MRKLLVMGLLSTSLLAQAVAPKVGLFVYDSEKTFIKQLAMSGSVDIDHPTEDGYEIYAPAGIEKFLDENGLSYTSLDAQFNEKDFANYPTHAQITKKLKDLTDKFPKISKLFSIGKSVNGQELWVVKISDNVDQDETEPEVKYISSMHGDEIVGRELMHLLIEDMLNEYGTNQEITNLIDNTEIFIMPSMNPDGSARKRRHNANWVDLNRNFPDFTTADNSNTWNGREPETQAVMQWQASRNFSLSANFHGGAVVVNYPWDTTSDAHPLEDTIRDMSLEYANLNPEMHHSTRFAGGVTNGYDWYHLDGGMQDWSYHWHNDLQVTVELSNRKWPSYSKIKSFYRDNKASLIRYLQLVHQGLGFKFADADKQGVVQIFRSHEENGVQHVESYGSFGFSNSEFYKILPEGNYTYVVTPEQGNQVVMGDKVISDKDELIENGRFIQIKSQI